MRRFTYLIDDGRWKIYELECFPIDKLHNHLLELQFCVELPEKYMHECLYAHSVYPNEEEALADFILLLRKDVDNKKISKENFFKEIIEIETIMLGAQDERHGI